MLLNTLNFSDDMFGGGFLKIILETRLHLSGVVFEYFDYSLIFCHCNMLFDCFDLNFIVFFLVSVFMFM